MKFYGREQQRNSLHRSFQREGLQVALIYGRRRVGKSELIKQCLRTSDSADIIAQINFFEIEAVNSMTGMGNEEDVLREILPRILYLNP